MAKTKESSVIQLLDLVYANANSALPHSWERLNHAMQNALSMAIGAGLQFNSDDLAKIAGSYRFGYWCGESVEWIYTEAVLVGNMTAIHSFEAWRGREPFIVDQESRAYYNNSGYLHGGLGPRKRERITVGSRFYWKGYLVTATSFSSDQKTVNACSYKENKAIERKFRITHEDIRMQRRASRTAQSNRRAEQIAT